MASWSLVMMLCLFEHGMKMVEFLLSIEDVIPEVRV